MATAAQDVLVAGITNLFTLFAVFIGMGVEHVWGVGKIVAHAIVAEALPMTLVTGLFFRSFHISVLNRPTEIFMRFGDIAHDDRRLDQQCFAASYNRNGVALVTLHADRFYFGSR